ncbi:MAG: hypothetical protein ABI723_05455 [Bacteroidia bacterium]
MEKQVVEVNETQKLKTEQAQSFDTYNAVKKRKRSIKLKIILAFLVICSLGALYGYYMYNKPVGSVSEINPDYKLDAKTLQALYEGNEKLSDQKYLGKVIEVSGNILSVETDAKGNINVLLETDNPVSAVSCSIDSKSGNEAAQLMQGQKVILKGYCSGYLSDVVMVRCVVVK